MIQNVGRVAPKSPDQSQGPAARTSKQHHSQADQSVHKISQRCLKMANYSETSPIEFCKRLSSPISSIRRGHGANAGSRRRVRCRNCDVYYATTSGKTQTAPKRIHQVFSSIITSSEAIETRSEERDTISLCCGRLRNEVFPVELVFSERYSG